MDSILIIDDDDSVRDSLFYHFEDCGFFVKTAESAEIAEQILKDNLFETVIVDLRLPNMRGDDFILKVYDLYPNTNFIIYTGSEEYTLSNTLKSFSRVCKRVFYKPVPDLYLFNKAIEEWV